MRIGILSLNQSVNDRPTRFVSKSDASRFVRQLTHERVSKRLIRELVANTTPSSNPDRHCITKLQVKKVPLPQLLPPTPPSTLNLFYPVSDLSSFGARNFRETWGCEQNEWQRRIGAT